MKTSRFKLGVRLGSAFFLVIVLTLAISAFAWREIAVVFDGVDEIATNWLPSIGTLGNLRVQANRLRRLEADLLLSPPPQRPALLQAMEKVNQDLLSEQNKYAALVSSEQEREGYARYQRLKEAYAGTSARLVQLVGNAPEISPQAIAFYAGESRQAYDAMAAQANALIELNAKGAAAAHASALGTYAGAKLQLGVLAGLTAALASVLAWWMTRQIVRPVGNAVQTAERIAAGDLSQALQCTGNDEIAGLLQALARMQQQLAATVREVRRNADSVATASAEIAQGNQDLSQRTEEQASALQQTAASMEELSTTVQQNADAARQASAAADQASKTAGLGGDTVAQVVQRMQGINAASQKIAEIIGVIDGIAFQTNILALNAAVEAARAGEQGRGFSVVASEVRTLAQRSAEASRQVRALVENSMQEVSQGSALVDQAGSTMREVVSAIQHVAQLVSGISAATAEQSAGVSQVGEAVAQMDQATQQNAALVEESAAAADSLRTQSAQLVQSVAVFRLHDGEPARGQPPAWNGEERRGAARAGNVVRPAFDRSAPAASATLPAPAAGRGLRTGTDDWASF